MNWFDRLIKYLEKENERSKKEFLKDWQRLIKRREPALKKIEKKEPSLTCRRWRTLRYEAIKKYGRKCQACGSISNEIHVDHIKPKSKFPELAFEISNLQILCRDCNLGKGTWDQTDWRK